MTGYRTGRIGAYDSHEEILSKHLTHKFYQKDLALTHQHVCSDIMLSMLQGHSVATQHVLLEEVKRRDDLIGLQNHFLREKEQLLTEKTATIAVKDAVITNKDNIILIQDNQISELTERNRSVTERCHFAEKDVEELRCDMAFAIRGVQHLTETRAKNEQQLSDLAEIFNATVAKLEDDKAMLRRGLDDIPLDIKAAHLQWVISEQDHLKTKQSLKRKRQETRALRNQANGLNAEVKQLHRKLAKAQNANVVLRQQRDKYVQRSEQFERYVKLTAEAANSHVHSARLLQASRDSAEKTRTLIHILDNQILHGSGIECSN